MQAESTYASAIQIGNPVSVHKAVAMLKEFDGIVEQASEEELAEACARGDKAGLYTCPHTGVALAALFKLIDKGEISKDEKVVVISTAHGLKFSNFKLRYHEQKLGNITSRHANLPVTLPADISAVKKVLDEKLGQI